MEYVYSLLRLCDVTDYGTIFFQYWMFREKQIVLAMGCNLCNLWVHHALYWKAKVMVNICKVNIKKTNLKILREMNNS